nr:ribonuclease H-like domain-containing protein [Tanacetum cinerariifolium]
MDTCTSITRRVEHLELDKIAQALEITKLKRRVKKLERRNKVKVLKMRRLQKVGTSQRIDTSDDTVMDDVSNKGRMIADMYEDVDVVLEEAKDVDDDAKDGQDADVQEEESEPAELQEVLDIVTTAKIINEVVTAASTTITAIDVPIPAAITTAAPKLTAAPSRRTNGVVIRDPEESTTTTSTIIHFEAKSKDKGKRILAEEPKPLKKQAQINQDEKYAKELEAELNKTIDWDETESQAKKNMMVYLKNVAGFKMDYFKERKYPLTRFTLDQMLNNVRLEVEEESEVSLELLRIEQYFLMTDYSLWEVILNGDSPAPTKVVDGALQPVAPTTAEHGLARKNELKAHGTLLMALPYKHQLKFNTYKDAKTLIEAIEKRFRGNTETKKVQKTLLKQQYKNFSGSSTESLDQIHDRLQKLITQLEILRRSHTLIWRNKTDLEEQSLDDLFNNPKIYKAEVKSSSSLRTLTQNIAFVSSSNTDSTNEPVSVTASVSAVSEKIHVSSLLNVDTLSNAVITLFFASQSSSPQLDNDDLKQIDADDLGEIDLKWQMAMLTFVRECRSPKDTRRNSAAEPKMRNILVDTSTSNALVSQCDGVGSYDWSFQADEEPTNYALMAFSFSSSSSDNELSPTKPDQDMSHTYRSSAPIIEDWVSDSKDESETKSPQNVLSFVSTPKLASPKPISNGKHRNRKACFVCKSLDHLIKGCDYHEKKMAQPTTRNHAQRGNHKQYAQMTLLNPQQHVVPAAVLTQSKHVPITVVKPITAVVSKIKVTRPRQDKHIVTKPNSPTKRHINRSSSLKTRNSPPRVTVVKAPMVNAAKGNPQHALKDKGVIDSGCLMHMTGNMSYLSDFEELNGGYVAFGGNPKGGRIFRKGKIRTCKLDFYDVYFVEELNFNLFSVSQMHDKKNGILFTDTKCLVLSPNFKLPDESQVLLRVPRENNMYNVNLKDIVPSGDLTCLFTKATLDES